ncbi:MAG TPA: glycosyltransferase [Polyangiaceae bacterium]|nr:glycosyltransferase [Polyangiaceae bacterium]
MALLALAAALVVVYTYVGYPLLVALWARLGPFPTAAREGFEPAVSVCMSVYNGEAEVARKVRNLQALDYPADHIEILVFSDGSTDATRSILEHLAAADPRVHVISSAERVGKPTALNRLARVATGEVLLLCDVRQTVDRGALRELVRSLSDPNVGCVSGSLVLAGATGAGVYWRYEQLIRGYEARVGRMVGVSGSLYALRRTDMAEIPGDILLDDMFVPLRLALATGKRIVLAEAARAHDAACDDGREFGRKVRTLAGNYQLVARMPRLLVPHRNPVWFPMMSHKVLRLACPWALALLFVASAGRAFDGDGGDFWRVFFCAQCVFYGLAGMGSAAGRVGALARTFVVLNAAAVVGLFRFLRGSQSVTW